MAQFFVPLKKVIDESYNVEIGDNLFFTLVDDINNGILKNASKIAIITDTTVQSLYGDMLFNLLQSQGIQVNIFSFPAGEKNKTRETKAHLEDEMINKSYGRDSGIIALGGGVVTDLAGFLAATFARGIPFVNYATTFLAAADASIGGKTAVDTPIATNLIGLFNQPAKVYIDISTWSTLTIREIRDGLAETIKHACIGDLEFFCYLEENIEQIITSDGKICLDDEICKYIAYKNCEIKYKVVVADEKESSLRQVLNLGHTIGRAVEVISDYQLSHGEAVAIGLAVQVALGNKLNFISDSEANRVIKLLKCVGLPTEIPSYVGTRELVDKLYTDKKVLKGKIRFVFQEGIGKIKCFSDGNYSMELDENYIFDTLTNFRDNHNK